MAWEETPRICLHMQLIAILSRTGVKSFMMTRQFVGSSGKWSDRVVCVVSMQPAKWGKQHEQQVQRITTFRLEQSCREVNNMILPGSCKSLPPNDEMT